MAISPLIDKPGNWVTGKMGIGYFFIKKAHPILLQTFPTNKIVSVNFNGVVKRKNIIH